MTETSQQTLSGHCLCGASGFVLIGAHNWVGHCHCESCRRATSSPFTTWIGQENGTWELIGNDIRTYDSSTGRQRGFCAVCGSQMFYKSDAYPNEVHFYAALLDDPLTVTPTRQYHAEERLSWVHLSDGLSMK
ncbi:MAG: GFA family protein [Yoonia sp.]|nr:GFA family protein [Yoonia sp.]